MTGFFFLPESLNTRSVIVWSSNMHDTHNNHCLLKALPESVVPKRLLQTIVKPPPHTLGTTCLDQGVFFLFVFLCFPSRSVAALKKKLSNSLFYQKSKSILIYKAATWLVGVCHHGNISLNEILIDTEWKRCKHWSIIPKICRLPQL